MSGFPALQNFLSAYFHQDWAVEHDSPQAVVDYYLEGESERQVAQLRDEIARLLAQDLDEDTLASLVQELGSEYDASQDGGTYRDWLRDIEERLAA
ncbi:hypothetical protein IP90_00406 [Luteimonas cucumeris]|uniref:CdiI immunity protein domain-containing protein n=1 Tax=Luteimonas cucumeris TaxID=985012 RepID=A0A562LEV3_9GAMM|nr:contact-dependent growth inhibition system immunity protein [Luteimonas cucumeris]TWI06142.1 hypothetical protein IP90_00406 [Luteimonas cucumeris]